MTPAKTAAFSRNSTNVFFHILTQCNLKCRHCYINPAQHGQNTLPLSTIQVWLEPFSENSNTKNLIFLGGEPTLHPDLPAAIRHARKLGFGSITVDTNGYLFYDILGKADPDEVDTFSFSLDGATRESHDRFRKVDGAYEGALNAMKIARKVGLDFQVNTTITKTNLDQIPKIQELAVEQGAVAHHIFLLVPTGRGKYIVDQEINAAEYEETLNWFYDQRDKTPLELKATCAPHYYRILRQRAKEEGKSVSFKTHGLDAVTRGCLGGIGFCFVYGFKKHIKLRRLEGCFPFVYNGGVGSHYLYGARYS